MPLQKTQTASISRKWPPTLLRKGLLESYHKSHDRIASEVPRTYNAKYLVQLELTEPAFLQLMQTPTAT